MSERDKEGDIISFKEFIFNELKKGSIYIIFFIFLIAFIKYLEKIEYENIRKEYINIKIYDMKNLNEIEDIISKYSNSYEIYFKQDC